VDLPTYTSIFHVERKLYKVHDVELPYPVDLLQLGVFGVTLLVIVAVVHALHLGFDLDWLWIYVVPPGAAAWAVSRPLLEAKRPHQWLLAQLRYLLEPRLLHGLAPAHEPPRVDVRVEVWQRLGAHWDWDRGSRRQGESGR
jgi:hypothetical protein